MDFEQIKELIKLVDSSDLAFFEISNGNDHIKMDKSLNRGSAEKVSDTSKSFDAPSENKTVQREEIKEVEVPKKEVKKDIEEKIEEEDSSLTTITSPMVGTFYASASPESEAFVKPGDTVSKGKVICIIEAMKLMNEIESDYNGEIVKCLVNDGDMVEYGQPLFKIKEA